MLTWLYTYLISEKSMSTYIVQAGFIKKYSQLDYGSSVYLNNGDAFQYDWKHTELFTVIS